MLAQFPQGCDNVTGQGVKGFEILGFLVYSRKS